MRYECDDPAFVGDFVELSDSWSRGQVREIWNTIPDDLSLARDDTEATFLTMLRAKVLSVHLTCVDAPPITQAAELTPERTEQIDTRLYTWFSGVWIRHLSGLSDLGKVLRQRLYVTSDTLIATVEAAPQSLNHS